MIRSAAKGWLFACLALASCGVDSAETDSGARAFSEVGRVVFEERDTDPIVDISYVGLRPDGGYILPDEDGGVVRLFDETGVQVSKYGKEGEGPGELQGPTGAAELPDGRTFVVQRGSPRLTIFSRNDVPVTESLPGGYGFWIEDAGEAIVAGVATRSTRFAILDHDGAPQVSFGERDPRIESAPFWIYFASESVAVLDSVVAVNTSLFPSIRLYGLAGDSVATFGQAPAEWTDVPMPPVSNIGGPGDRQLIENWSRSFTVVRRMAAVDDSLLVVEYGRFEPTESDPYYVVPTTADAYRLDGTKIVSGVQLPGHVVGGGRYLLVVVGEPPGPWTIAKLRWNGDI